MDAPTTQAPVTDSTRLKLLETGKTEWRAVAMEAALISGDGEWLKRIHDNWDNKGQQ